MAAYLDEVLAGAAVNHTGRLYVTGELTVRYVKGMPIECPLLGRGRAVLDSGKYLDLEGQIEDWDTRRRRGESHRSLLPDRTGRSAPASLGGRLLNFWKDAASPAAA